MQLDNRTNLPDSLVRRMFALAAETVGAKTAGVLARLSWVSRGQTTGVFDPNWSARHWKYGWVACRGMVRVSTYVPSPEPLHSEHWAKELFRTAVHEASHLADRQQGRSYGRTAIGSRGSPVELPHDEREGECRAYDHEGRVRHSPTGRMEQLYCDLARAVEAVQASPEGARSRE